jgi:hypothetical protein
MSFLRYFWAAALMSVETGDQADVRTEPTKNGAPGYPARQVVAVTTEIHRWPGAYIIERSLASPDASWTAHSGGNH